MNEELIKDEKVKKVVKKANKANLEIEKLILEKAELSPDEVWYVGDQYECDIVGAKNSGIFPVWYIGAIDMKYEPKDGILTISEWDELENYILDDLRG